MKYCQPNLIAFIFNDLYVFLKIIAQIQKIVKGHNIIHKRFIIL